MDSYYMLDKGSSYISTEQVKSVRQHKALQKSTKSAFYIFKAYAIHLEQNTIVEIGLSYEVICRGENPRKF